EFNLPTVGVAGGAVGVVLRERDQRPAVVFPDGLHGVGDLAVVFNRILAADGEHALGGILAQRPLNDIDIVRAEIGELAAGIVPEPPEFVQATIAIVRHLWRRTKPQVPIQAGRRRAVWYLADPLRRFIAQVETLGHRDFADSTARDQFDGVFDVG